MLASYTFHWYSALKAVPAMLVGALTTLQVSAVSMCIGVSLAVLLALAASSEKAWLRYLSSAWVSVARNTPALFQIYIAYFGLASIGVYLDSLPALVAGISFNNAGYLSETFRGGLKAIPRTQMLAARSLGMTAPRAFWEIIFPQMFRVVFFPMTNQMVWAVLMTSLGVIVGLNSDLMGVTQELNTKSFRTFELFLIAAVIYYLLSKSMVLTARLLAWRVFKY